MWQNTNKIGYLPGTNKVKNRKCDKIQIKLGNN